MESVSLLTYDDQHLTPMGSCKAKQGVMNVDGKCVLGGYMMPSGLRGDKLPGMGFPSVGCVAYPVFVQDMVPYTSGMVAGSDYEFLASMKEGTKLLKDPY